MAMMWEGGRDLDGIEPVTEYCDSRFLEACDIGRGSVVLRAGTGEDVISGGSGGWAWLEAGGGMAGGDVAGDEPGDMIAVILGEMASGSRGGKMIVGLRWGGR